MKPPGIGNSPPARKFAVSPEIAVRFGSASVRITPARSMARSVAVTAAVAPPMTTLVLTSAWPTTGNGLVLLKLSDALRRRSALPLKIDAELLDDVALHFGDGDLEHHLVAAAHRDAVDHLVAVAGKPRGEIEGLLRLGRARRRAATA